MRSWSIPAGRIAGVELRVHLTFFFLLVFVWLLEAPGLGAEGAWRGVALVAMVLGSVLLHELGHALAALHSGYAPRMLMLLPIGGVPLDEETGEHPLRQRVGREIAIALSGPLLNLLLAAATAVIVAAVAPEAKLLQRPLIYSGALLRSLVWVNAGLAALNLLPAFPLDGGRITRVLLARRMEPQVATRYSVMFGQGFAMILILAGIWNTWLMLTGFFLFVAAQLEERSLVFQSVVQNVRMEEVMLTDFCTLSPADTLEDALAKAVHTLQDDFPVIRGGDLVGVISRTKIVEALRSGGNAYVQSAMSRVFEVAQRNETLAAAFKKLSHRGHTLIPVVEGERLVGIVTLQNLMHSMGLLAETRRLSK